ncbi:unnamed protein product [Amoebophrya sp. A120]|nr:unnamed protein product [Amoebophrya sp. A120]|eukprot:GSA120T00010353001.1
MREVGRHRRRGIGPTALLLLLRNDGGGHYQFVSGSATNQVDIGSSGLLAGGQEQEAEEWTKKQDTLTELLDREGGEEALANLEKTLDDILKQDTGASGNAADGTSSNVQETAPVLPASGDETTAPASAKIGEQQTASTADNRIVPDDTKNPGAAPAGGGVQQVSRSQVVGQQPVVLDGAGASTSRSTKNDKPTTNEPPLIISGPGGVLGGGLGQAQQSGDAGAGPVVVQEGINSSNGKKSLATNMGGSGSYPSSAAAASSSSTTAAASGAGPQQQAVPVDAQELQLASSAANTAKIFAGGAQPLQQQLLENQQPQYVTMEQLQQALLLQQQQQQQQTTEKFYEQGDEEQLCPDAKDQQGSTCGSGYTYADADVENTACDVNDGCDFTATCCVLQESPQVAGAFTIQIDPVGKFTKFHSANNFTSVATTMALTLGINVGNITIDNVVDRSGGGNGTNRGQNSGRGGGNGGGGNGGGGSQNAGGNGDGGRNGNGGSNTAALHERGRGRHRRGHRHKRHRRQHGGQGRVTMSMEEVQVLDRSNANATGAPASAAPGTNEKIQLQKQSPATPVAANGLDASESEEPPKKLVRRHDTLPKTSPQSMLEMRQRTRREEEGVEVIEESGREDFSERDGSGSQSSASDSDEEIESDRYEHDPEDRRSTRRSFVPRHHHSAAPHMRTTTRKKGNTWLTSFVEQVKQQYHSLVGVEEQDHGRWRTSRRHDTHSDLMERTSNYRNTRRMKSEGRSGRHKRRGAASRGQKRHRMKGGRQQHHRQQHHHRSSHLEPDFEEVYENSEFPEDDVSYTTLLEEDDDESEFFEAAERGNAGELSIAYKIKVSTPAEAYEVAEQLEDEETYNDFVAKLVQATPDVSNITLVSFEQPLVTGTDEASGSGGSSGGSNLAIIICSIAVGGMFMLLLLVMCWAEPSDPHPSPGLGYNGNEQWRARSPHDDWDRNGYGQQQGGGKYGGKGGWYGEGEAMSKPKGAASPGSVVGGAAKNNPFSNSGTTDGAQGQKQQSASANSNAKSTVVRGVPEPQHAAYDHEDDSDI